MIDDIKGLERGYKNILVAILKQAIADINFIHKKIPEDSGTKSSKYYINRFKKKQNTIKKDMDEFIEGDWFKEICKELHFPYDRMKKKFRELFNGAHLAKRVHIMLTKRKYKDKNKEDENGTSI